MAHTSEKVSFPGHTGELLAARLDLPAGEPRAFALFAHCFTCSKDILAAARIANGLADNGFAVLRFDFTRLGKSEGEFANSNFSSNVADLLSVADAMRQSGQAPSLLVGHSLGGAAVLSAAIRPSALIPSPSRTRSTRPRRATRPSSSTASMSSTRRGSRGRSRRCRASVRSAVSCWPRCSRVWDVAA